MLISDGIFIKGGELKVMRALWRLVIIIGQSFLSLLVLSCLVFVLLKAVPGDELQAWYGAAADNLTLHEQEALREQLGLNAPWYQQYGHWLWQVIHLDLGLSLAYKQPLNTLLPPLIYNTVLLGGISCLTIFTLVLLLALLCARFEGQFIDKALCSLGTLFFFTPAFWLAVLLILLLSVNLGYLPSSGAYDPGMQQSIGNRLYHLILPVTVLTLSHMWYYAALLRGRLLNELRADYILQAKASGLSSCGILMQALRALIPYSLHLMAIALPHILGGTYVIEAVFNYPGLGRLLVASARNHDYTVLLATVLFTGTLAIGAGLMAKLVSSSFDPRWEKKMEERW